MTPTEVARRMFEGYERAGVDGALEVVSPDAVLVVGPETSAEPDTYEGPDGARRYFGGFEGALDEVRFELLKVHEESPSALICDVRLSGLGEMTRIPVEQIVLMTFAIRHGLITRIVAHPTMESAEAEFSSTPE
jgi:ketosteroid isomerase-like protein